MCVCVVVWLFSCAYMCVCVCVFSCAHMCVCVVIAYGTTLFGWYMIICAVQVLFALCLNGLIDFNLGLPGIFFLFLFLGQGIGMNCFV